MRGDVLGGTVGHVTVDVGDVEKVEMTLPAW